MYSNIFDTVKTNDLDLINFEGLLYSSILSGLHPTLSLNQAIDSTALLAIARQDDFLELMKSGYIKVALFGKYTGKKDGIYSFLNDKLKECIKQEKASFKFSSLPFLYSGDYSERQLVKLYKAIRKILNGEYNCLSSYKVKELGLDSNSDDVGKIEEYIETIKKISGAVSGQYILPPKSAKKTKLYKKVLKAIDVYEKERPNSDLMECLEDLKKALKRQRKLEKQNESEEKTNSRSYIYKAIEALGCAAKQEEELKYLVDLCYNEIVAESIADNEDDIMINNKNYEYAQVYFDDMDQDNRLDKCEQKLSLVRNSRNINRTIEPNVLSWKMLNEILKEADPNKCNLQGWYEDMQKYCEKQGMKDIELGRKKLLSGTVPFAITVVSNVILAKLFQSEYFDDSFIRQTQAGIMEDVIKEGAPFIVGELFSWPEAADIERERKIIRAKQSVVKECLTQTALLKKDYCCEAGKKQR